MREISEMVSLAKAHGPPPPPEESLPGTRLTYPPTRCNTDKSRARKVN